MKTLAFAITATALAATAASAASIGQYDANGDRFASFAEVTSVNPLVSADDFSTLDANGDRRLSSVEVQAPGAQAILDRGTGPDGAVLGTAAIAGGSFVTQAQLAAAYPGLTQIDFRAIDSNDDGRVSANELYAPNAQETVNLYRPGSQILVSLNAIDTDGSGFVTLGELQAVYPNLSGADLADFDVNRDQRISFTEFYSPASVSTLGESK